MMKAIVAGGAGFLGSHLVDKLIKEGYQVLAVDDLSTGSKQNLSHLEDNPNFKFLNQDVSKFFQTDFEADEIYHLASPASPNAKSAKSYHALPYQTMMANSFGTWLLAQLALEKKAKFLFASTSEVYGDPLEHPQTESYRGNVSTTGPRSVYDESKRFGETIVAAFIRSNQLDGRIIRIFNTYGPRMALDDGRAVIEFIKSALAGEALSIFGSGQQTRSFCYVDDLIEGIFLAMQKGLPGQIYNLGNPQEFSILELAQKIKDLTNSSSPISKVADLPEDDPQRRCPDIKKAIADLGWQPTVELAEGLSKLIGSIKNA